MSTSPEITDTMTLTAALDEAWRCLQCADPPCQQGCPAGVEVRTFIRQIRNLDLRGAALTIRRANVLGSSCARVCAQAEQCQRQCTRAQLDRPIDIAGLQRFACDYEISNGAVLPPAAPSSGHRVAVVGAGPAGLAAAAELARLGHQVELFEKAERPGGLLAHGIPPTRLPQQVVDHEIAAVQAQGVTIHTGRPAERIEQLRDRFEAVVVAVGLTRSLPLALPGEDLPGVYPALSLLAHRLGPAAPRLGPRVLVIGGGNTAMDAASSARRLGAREVTVLYRRSEAEMPAWAEEIARVRREGVTIRTQVQPVEFIAADGRLAALRCQLTELGEPDESGRRRPVPVAGTVFELAADAVLVAAGETVDLDLARALGLRIGERGRVSDNPALGIFAAGDLGNARRTVVDAVAAGRRAARAVHEKLGAGSVPAAPRPQLPEQVDLGVDLCGVRFQNPFLLAAAPPTDDLDMLRRGLEAGWAGAVLKTTAVESEPVELKYPMMHGYDVYGRRLVGLGNIDLISEHHIDVVEKRLRELRREFPGKVLVGSIMGSERQHWQELVERLEEAGADIIECSFSCPQGTLGGEGSFAGQMLGQNVELTRQVTSWIKAAARRAPVVIKITPQVADIKAVARAVAAGGADAVCASNTIPSLMGIDLDNFLPLPTVGGSSSFAGLSGPAILPITLRNIALVAQASGLPVTGTGGPVGWRDAVQMMLVGAVTVQFCTAVMTFGFDIIEDLQSGLAWYLHEKGLSSPAQLVGRALDRITTHDQLAQPGPVRSRIDEQLCIGCGRCFITCRDGGHRAIEFSDQRLPRVDDERCVGCGMCQAVCPLPGCIHMEVSGT